MSLEAKITELTEAVAHLTQVMQGGTVSSATVEKTSGDEAKQGGDAPLVWYHKPDDRKVWQEPEAGRRKGIIKVDEATAQRLQEQYAEEDAQADQSSAAEAAGSDLDMDFGDGDPNELDDNAPMDDEEFSGKWKDWTKRAMQHAMSDGTDKAEAQNDVKRFVLPVVRSFVAKDAEPKVGNVGPDLRRKFLAKVEDYFNS